MRIVIIGSRQSIHVVRWANALAMRGHSIYLLTMHPPSESLNKKVHIVPLPFPNPFGYILNILQAKRIIQKIKPDIIHSFYAFGHGFLARMAGYKPHLLSVLGSDVYDDPLNNALYRRIVRNNILKANFVASTSVTMKKQILRLAGEDTHVAITPFGVDTDLFVPVFKKNDHDYDFVVGTVKAMKKKYGVDILIKAFAAFCTHYPDKNFKLVLVGGGEQLEELKLLAKMLGVYSKCEFVGKVTHSEVPAWLNSFDIYVAVSRYNSESFGVAVLEAMACEKAVIVSDVGGLPEVVQKDVTGLIVPKEDVKATKEAIIALYENSELRKKMGEAGRQHVLDTYRWSESVQIMEQIYRQVISENKNMP